MQSKNVKIIVTVPIEATDKLRQAISEAGAGKIGNYQFCSFSSIGIGRFLPSESARPAFGTVGVLEQVEEERIEVQCSRELLKTVVQVIRSNHPYEEIALDIISLEGIEF